jgi:hypothetical protein
LFDEKDKAVILYAERLTRAAGAGRRDPALDELKRNFTEDQLVELALVVSMANFTNPVQQRPPDRARSRLTIPPSSLLLRADQGHQATSCG